MFGKTTEYIDEYGSQLTNYYIHEKLRLHVSAIKRRAIIRTQKIQKRLNFYILVIKPVDGYNFSRSI
jgi:hypothetical protein